jgi:hypothetical protein
MRLADAVISMASATGVDVEAMRIGALQMMAQDQGNIIRSTIKS